MKQIFYLVILSFSSLYGQNLTQYINPFIGTGGHGHTFPGVTLPFAMVQLSPDTRIDGSWDGCSGYHYSDNTIYGFSHTHLSGTGCSDYGDIAFMPYFGKDVDDNLPVDSLIARGVKFSHKNEQAKAGYYSVLLNNGVKVELTSTLRAGIQKYTFPRKGKAKVIFNLKHRDELLQGSIQELDIITYKGMRISKAWAERQKLYYFFHLDKLPTSNQVMKGLRGDEYLILEFDVEKNQELHIKTAISGVDEDGARLNLDKEMPDFDFERFKINANAIWNKKMSLLNVFGGTSTERTNFYTALYHCMIHPSIFNDVDGRYRGRDDEVYDTENEFEYYTVFSLWDTYRALHPLLSFLERKKTNDFVVSFMKQYEQVKKLPVWELWGNETNCMIGYHAVSVMWDTYNKGIVSFHAGDAFKMMLATGRDTTSPSMKSYIKHGYVRADDDAESVSKTIEYAYNDWCIAQMAKKLNAEVAMDEFTKRSRNWINVFDPTTGFMRPRLNGTLLTPFSPYMVDNHFTEANSYQYSFYVPHDLNHFKSVLGGEDALDKKLDQLFAAKSKTEGREQADITGLIGQYAHGNEPSHHIAFLYKNKTKRNRIVKFIRDSFYKNAPDGLIGNEDCGQMSAWYVLASLGMYPVCPGDKRMVSVDGLFDSVKIKADMWTITRKKQDSFEFYNLKGQELVLPEYEMELQRQPFIYPCAKIFKTKQWIKFGGGESIVYHINGGTAREFKDSILIDTNVHIEFYSVYNGKKTKSEYASFYRLPSDRMIQIKSKYKAEYHAGGDMALIDGIRGTEVWRKGDWHGYQGQDFEAVITLNNEREIKKVATSFLQDQKPWIFFPTEYVISISSDGKNFTEVVKEKMTVGKDDEKASTKLWSHLIGKRAKYIKVWAKNYGKIPEWHPGKGGDAYIFIDEIEVQ
jgi:predicted alpha-1,2-mannosidase